MQTFMALELNFKIFLRANKSLLDADKKQIEEIFKQSCAILESIKVLENPDQLDYVMQKNGHEFVRELLGPIINYFADLEVYLIKIKNDFLENEDLQLMIKETESIKNFINELKDRFNIFKYASK